MAEILFPLVRWAQDENNVYLKVELRDVDEPEIKISTKRLEFQAIGVGAKGRNVYSFNLDFYGSLSDEESHYRINDRCVEFVLHKTPGNNDILTGRWWPQLTARNERLFWLKIDFDRWRDPSDGDSGDEKERHRDILENFNMEEYEKRQAEQIVDEMMREKGNHGKSISLTTPYLLTYNAAMFIGFLLIVIDLSLGYYKEGKDYFPKVWDETSKKIYCCQLAQFLEIAHALLGYVKSSPFTTSLQVLGRAFVLFMILGAEPRMHDKPFVFYLFFVWSLVEIIRYPYYLLATVKKELGLITWLRYTAWIILYPLGFLCEGIIILRAMIYFEETKKYNYPMPNKFNVSVDFPSVLKLYLICLFLPGIFLLMSHMRQMRLKKLQKKKKVH